MTKAQRIVQEALALPDDERTEVALALLDSVEAPDPQAGKSDEELGAELRRRAGEVERGEAQLKSWDELRPELEARRKR